MQLIRFIRVLLVTLALSSLGVSATPKATPCKPYKINACVPKRTLPKAFRESQPNYSNYLTPLQVYPSEGTAVPFPSGSNNTAEPLVLIPAGTETITLCQIRLGKFECTVISKFKDCPNSISLRDADSGISYTCDVDCDNRRASGKPDENGNCDCDVKYDTCRS